MGSSADSDAKSQTHLIHLFITELVIQTDHTLFKTVKVGRLLDMGLEEFVRLGGQASLDPHATVSNTMSTALSTFTQSSLCRRCPARPAIHACDPRSCNTFGKTNVDGELEYAYRSEKLRCVAKGWNSIETPCRVLQHCMLEIAAGLEVTFRQQETKCHEDSGASPRCQCNLCRARLCGDHSTRCCLACASIGLNMF